MIEYRVWYRGDWLTSGSLTVENDDDAFNQIYAACGIPLGDSSGGITTDGLVWQTTGDYYIEFNAKEGNA